MLKAQLEQLTHKQVTIGGFGLKPPYKVEIKNLNIGGLVKADYALVSPSLLAFLTDNIGFNEISLVNPEITFERFPPVKIESSVTTVNTPAVSGAVQANKGGQVSFDGIVIKHLNVKNGKVNLIDHSVGQEGITISVKDIYFDLTNFYTVPHSAVTNFKFSGKIPWQEGQEEGEVSADGWLDLAKKDMRATLSIKGIDGVYLHPYFRTWVDLEKSRIQKAKLNFSSNINSLNNNLTAECQLALSDIIFRERTPEEQEEKAEKLAHAVIDIFKATDQGNIVLNFTVRTKMDRPQFGFGSIKGAVEQKLATSRRGGFPVVESVVFFPVNLLKGAVRTTSDLSRAVIDGTFAVGNEIKKGVEGSFKKEN